MIEVTDCYLTLAEVCRYVRKTQQCVLIHRKQGLLRTTGKRVRLDHFNRYLARKYPLLPRLNSVAELDAWRGVKDSTP